MSNQSKQEEEAVLIDFLLGHCETDVQRRIRRRLDEDKGFRRLYEDLANAWRALGLSADVDPPEDLTAKTLSRIQSARRTQALLDREELARPAVGPTFSARELSIVAAAIFVLAVIFLPSFRQARIVSQRQRCASRLGRLGTALLTYASANDNCLPAVYGSTTRWLSDDDKPAVSNSAALFKLLRYRYVQSPTLFQCPAIGGGTFEVKAGMVDFPAGRYIGYSYQHSIGPHHLRVTHPKLAAVADRMAILADSNPVFEEGRFRQERLNQPSRNHANQGQNVLFLDMHVEWAPRPNVGVNGDNIYLAKGIRIYRGTERPTDSTDTFLLPSFSPPNGNRPSDR